MIRLYTWSTPNGRKVSIGLEELGLPYEVHPVNIGSGAQHDPAFVAISPNGRIPAIVDEDAGGMTLMESGAILVWLAEKTGRLLPASGPSRARVFEWLMWQMGGFGPMLGQAHHFLHFHPEASAYASERYGAETRRLYGVLDRRLRQSRFVSGDELSIADIAIWPWAARFELHKVDLAEWPGVLRWYGELAARPAFQRGYAVPTELAVPVPQALVR
jgi:GST-like protein